MPKKRGKPPITMPAAELTEVNEITEEQLSEQEQQQQEQPLPVESPPSPPVLPSPPPSNVVNISVGRGRRSGSAVRVRAASDPPPPPTHDEIRDRWLQSLPGPVAYARGEFKRYQQGLWNPVEEQAVKKDILNMVEQSKIQGIKPSASLLNSVVALTAAHCSIPSERFDANPDLLVCANGTLHIPTRKLGAWEPKDYATSGVRYGYDPHATYPAWSRYLDYLTSTLGKDVVEFLQEYAGYSITTDIKHEMAVWLWGPAGSGKSTFIEGIRAALSDRVGILGLAQLMRSSFALADVPGKTLLISTEQPSGFIKCLDLLNALISGESIHVERKYHDAYQFRSRAKLLWAMNDLPRILEAANGLFRRIGAVEFPVLPVGERKPELKEAIKLEGCGILNWLLDGLDRLTERGRFEIPKVVRESTEEFQRKCDIPAIFFSEMVEKKPGSSIQSLDLYETYVDWCKQNGHKPESHTRFADDARRLGYHKSYTHGRVFWRDLAVTADINKYGSDFEMEG